MYYVVEDAEAVARRAAGWIADAIRKSVDERNRCALALVGGNSPRGCYERLPAQPRVPWDRVEIYFGDERAVPPDSSDSNYHMAWELFLRHVPITAAQIHRMEVERGDLASVAREYEAILPESLDVLMLGVGVDGHTASLFPHAPSLSERERRVMPVAGGDPFVQRLTITPPVIRSAHRILVIATGAEKAQVVARALEGMDDVAGVPAQLARQGTWILDRAAAGGLTRQS